MHFGAWHRASWDRIESPQVNWKTDGILTLFKHISEANPASYLSLLVNSQWKLAQMIMPFDTQNLKNSDDLQRFQSSLRMFEFFWHPWRTSFLF